MNEGTKTGTFWGVAVVTLAIAAFVAWPKTYSNQSVTVVGNDLFEKFKDPLAAASMKIVTFDETQGTLETFEVRKDSESGRWTIPSRDGYPADAIEQMKDAANALVGIKILDIQTSNAEDHDDLGVAEPKLEDLEVGDDGVGRLVTFKDEKQDTLASLIIGDPLKDDASKRYVRIPNQDPVYVVKFEDSPLTTKFRDWIEDDLLQLSSIDIADMLIKDYTATLGQRGLSLSRNYTADVAVDGTQWELRELLDYDPKDPRIEPKVAEFSDDKKLNKTKLDGMKNALDDLKIVNVYRKPEGVSATLKANKDLLEDETALTSLAKRGFYPVDAGPNGEAEILSANGEMTVSCKDGVKYVLRFGNISGVSSSGDSESDDEEGSEDGVNRFLLVTTMVDEAKFPAPKLKEIPQTLEDLDAILNPPTQDPPSEDMVDDSASGDSAAGDSASGDSASGDSASGDAPTDEEPEMETDPGEEKVESVDGEEEDVEADSKKGKEADKTNAEPDENPKETKESAEESDTEAPVEEPSGESESTGSGETSGSGQGQDDGEDSPVDSEETTTATDDVVESGNETEEPATSEDEELTEEELQERLEAEQEKITKENQRMLDARKDQLDAAERKVRGLNERFADWYYVIPEDTYSKLRIKRDELFETDKAETKEAADGGSAMPQFNIPGLPGN